MVNDQTLQATKKKSYPETRANAPFIQRIEEILKQAFDNSKTGVKKNNTS